MERVSKEFREQDLKAKDSVLEKLAGNQEKVKEMAKEAEKTMENGVKKGMEKYHVLVVEDDNEIANAIKIYLQNQGYDVYVGNDGLEGLEIVEKETIHLAIVDIMMPRMDGLTMVAKLREKYDFPVIFLSAKSEDIDKIMGLNLGGDDYVTKPFVPMELMARVRSHLRR